MGDRQMLNTALEDQLIHLLSHELSNEIGFARMQIDQLRHDQDEDARVDSLNKLSTCLTRFDKARKSLKEPLEIKRYIGISDVKPIGFTEIVQESIAERNIVSGFAINLQIAPKNKPLTLVGDYELYSRLIKKLLDNAKHLNKAKKAVQVKLVAQQQSIELSLQITGNWSEINVNELFQPFGFITNDDPCGFDLYVAKLIINHYGGKVTTTVNGNLLEIKIVLPG